jgi:hypothetical protein
MVGTLLKKGKARLVELWIMAMGSLTDIISSTPSTAKKRCATRSMLK